MQNFLHLKNFIVCLVEQFAEGRICVSGVFCNPESACIYVLNDFELMQVLHYVWHQM
jgi:hypothetical protein